MLESVTGTENIAADLFDLVDQTQERADDLDIALRMYREGEITEQQFMSAIYRVKYKLNESCDNVRDEYKLD